MKPSPVLRVRQALQRQLVAAILGNERVARQHGLLVTDFQILHLLTLRDDIRTPRGISDATGMPTSTVTKLVDRLEAGGFVKRSPDPIDRRRVILDLDDEAIAPLKVMYGHTDEEFDSLSETFSVEELEIVARYLEGVSEFYHVKQPPI